MRLARCHQACSHWPIFADIVAVAMELDKDGWPILQLLLFRISKNGGSPNNKRTRERRRRATLLLVYVMQSEGGRGVEVYMSSVSGNLIVYKHIIGV